MRFRPVVPTLNLVLALCGGAWSSSAQSPAPAPAPAPAPEPKARPARAPRENPAERFARLDANHDGMLTPEEVGNPILFGMLDLDRDGQVTRTEASAAISSMEISKHWAKTKEPASGEPAAPAPGAGAEPLAEALRVLPGTGLGLGERIADLELRDLDGRRQRLFPAKGQKALVVAVTSPSCPLSTKLAPGLARMESDFASRGVGFAYLAPVATDTPAALAGLRRSAGWKGPVLRDADRRAAAALGVRSTTEVLVYDAAGTLCYRGAVDDQHGLGYSRATARVHPLRDALEAVLDGREPEVEATTAPGCVVELPAAKPAAERVTYHRQIARLLQRHCVECHREGGIGPFPLGTYADVVGHAGMIRKQVERGAMPPWFASNAHGVALANDRSLPEADRGRLLAWLASGRAEGDARETPLPRRFAPGWAIGKPDAVYEIPRAISVPAEGVMEYQNVEVDPGLKEDRWVGALEIQPTERSVVHHVLVFARQPGDRKGRRGDDAADERVGFFAAYAPGNASERFPEGFGRKLAAGSVLRFQIHYTPNGRAVQDRVRLGLKFLPGPPAHPVHVLGLANGLIEIPPGASRHAEFAAATVPRDVRVVAFMPHMHLRGAAFRFEALDAQRKPRTLLEVPRWDFNWQLSYRCAEPVALPAGTLLRATGWYDNSPGNPANPDPKAVVHWGRQTFEEMMLGYIEYYYPDEVP